MGFANYPRKGTINRANFKLMLNADSVFNRLEDDQKNAIINICTHKLVSFLNKNNNDDFNFDTVGGAESETNLNIMGYEKYVRYVIIKAGMSYEGFHYDNDDYIIEQPPYGFSENLAETLENNIFTVRSENEFTNSVLYNTFNANVIVSRPDNNAIVIDVTDAEDVVVFAIYKL